MEPRHLELDVRLDLDAGRLDATARITLEGPPGAAVSILLNRGLQVERAAWSGHGEVDFRQTRAAFADLPALEAIHIVVPSPPSLGARRILEIAYRGEILDYVDTGMRYLRDRIDAEHTILRPDAFSIPVLGVPDLAENRRRGRPAFSWEASVTVPVGHVVASVGEPIGTAGAGRAVRFDFRSRRPSSRLDLAVARYGLLEADDLRIYHLPGDEDAARVLRNHLRHGLSLLAEWFGPLEREETFTLIEIPDGWGSQADVTGVLQEAGAFRDPARRPELYHELTHLWNAPSLDPAPPRWEEGLATFLQDWMSDRLDGTHLLETQVERCLASVRRLHEAYPASRDTPLRRTGELGQTYLAYPVGALLFRALCDLVGPEAFLRLLGDFQRIHRASGATTDDLVRFLEEESPVDPGPLLDDWLDSTRALDSILDA